MASGLLSSVICWVIERDDRFWLVLFWSSQGAVINGSFILITSLSFSFISRFDKIGTRCSSNSMSFSNID